MTAAGTHDARHGAHDSAGVPWAGRSFEPTAFGTDDGTAPPALIAAITAFHDGAATAADVVDALRPARLLVPLVAHVAETADGAHGLTADKKAELSLVTVAGPDGRDVLPVFSSAAAMGRWNRTARPIPVDARRAALAAASEGTDLIVLDAASDTEFALRRSAIRALAQDTGWLPPHADPRFTAAFHESVAKEPAVTAVALEPGDPTARLTGPELAVRLTLIPGLDAATLDSLLARLREAWAVIPDVTDIDGVTLRLE